MQNNYRKRTTITTTNTKMLLVFLLMIRDKSIESKEERERGGRDRKVGRERVREEQREKEIWRGKNKQCGGHAQLFARP